MSNVPIRILLLERDAAAAHLVQRTFAGVPDKVFRVQWADRLENALEMLNGEVYGVILIGKTLADADREDALNRLAAAAPNALILVPGKAGVPHAVPHGAQDGVVTDQVEFPSLPQILPYLMRQAATAAALRKSEARFRAMSDASPLGIFVADAEGGCVYINGAYEEISGLEFEQIVGTSWTASVHPDDRGRVLSAWRDATKNEEPFRLECRFQRWDASVVWVRLNSAAMRDGPAPHGLVLTVEDITDRKTMESGLRAAEEALFEQKERAQVTLDSIGDAVLTTDLQGRVTYLNLMAEAMTGWSRGEAEGRPLEEVFRIIDGNTRETAADPARLAIEQDRTMGLSAECVLIRRDGEELPIEDSVAPIHDRAGRVSGAVIVFHDVSQSRAEILRMAHLAQHDALTGLPNRVLLSERLSQAIGLARRHSKQVGLLYLDLDHFKPVNDSLGHAVGDVLLKSVATRLLGCVRGTDTVCRQGGDEFVILLTEIEHLTDAAQVAEKCRAALSAPFLVRGREVRVTPSIGISVYPDDGGDADTVLQKADMAMLDVKAGGRNSYEFFKPRAAGEPARRNPLQGDHLRNPEGGPLPGYGKGL
jgi:diguanylate cyclase (GGDEF)-like protein/PAS domain S-box-containing protein